MNDDELTVRLRELFPPVPDHVLALGNAAYDWFVPSAVLATLSSETTGVPAGVRGGGSRTLVFAGRRVGVEIEICGREIAGQLTPPSAAEVVLRSPGAELATRADEAGAFALTGVPSGLVSLLFRVPGSSPVITSWVRV